MDHTKIVPADPGSPCQELSVRGLRFLIALLIFLNYFSCASTGGPIQLYIGPSGRDVADTFHFSTNLHRVRLIAMLPELQ